VTGLTAVGGDSNVQWILSIDDCVFTVRFADLILHRRFHAEHVRGDGLSLRLRQRRAAFAPEVAAALPPIPGFADPPYAGPKPPPITDAEYDLWSVWLEDVVARHVRDIWIDTIHSTGDATVSGRWYFKPVRWLDVGPAAVEWGASSVSLGGREKQLRIDAAHAVVTIHPSDVRTYAADGFARHVSAIGDVAGAVHLDPLSRDEDVRGQGDRSRTSSSIHRPHHDGARGATGVGSRRDTRSDRGRRARRAHAAAGGRALPLPAGTHVVVSAADASPLVALIESHAGVAAQLGEKVLAPPDVFFALQRSEGWCVLLLQSVHAMVELEHHACEQRAVLGRGVTLGG
jgi:hypothetical protein